MHCTLLDVCDTFLSKPECGFCGVTDTLLQPTTGMCSDCFSLAALYLSHDSVFVVSAVMSYLVRLTATEISSCIL